MKTKMYFLSICLLVLSVSASAKMKDGKVLSGNSLTELGTYSVMKSEVPMVVQNQAVRTYDLIYENASKPVRIGVITEKKCTTFLVRSAEFEIQYTCDKGLFGVKKMDKKYRELSETASDSKIDNVNLYAQRVISQKPKTEEELLGLIACYFPNLVEKQYHAEF
jgi:hypothetical protein